MQRWQTTVRNKVGNISAPSNWDKREHLNSNHKLKSQHWFNANEKHLEQQTYHLSEMKSWKILTSECSKGLLVYPQYSGRSFFIPFEIFQFTCFAFLALYHEVTIFTPKLESLSQYRLSSCRDAITLDQFSSHTGLDTSISL